MYRPALSQSLTRTPLPGFEPGWLWKWALEAADGDARNAVRAIGVCGHDDVGTGSNALFFVVPDATVALPLIETERNWERAASIKELERALKENPSLEKSPSDESKTAVAHLRDLQQNYDSLTPESLVGTRQRLYCPKQDSLFYVPESLGKGWDISEKTRERVIRLQEGDWAERRARELKAEGLGHLKVLRGNSLPAKYYHVYAAAFVSCELLTRGHPPVLVENVQRILGWAYRTQRFTSGLVGVEQKESQDVRDAYELMKRETLTAHLEFRGRELGLATNLRVPFPAYLEGRWVDRTLRKPKGWSNERYAKARRRFDQFMADWAWTTEQHVLGSRFAAHHCRALKKAKD